MRTANGNDTFDVDGQVFGFGDKLSFKGLAKACPTNAQCEMRLSTPRPPAYQRIAGWHVEPASVLGKHPVE